ncbi:MAG: MmgE/PrpD family protein [Clostridiales bacterium]|jgi:2-methylcitrate dehydratase PrpD|nr:MmgE/PrpD family protein [Clostridiales bacterium]
MNLSHSLAQFVANTSYEDIPSDVIDIQKKSVMDAIAITLGASTLGDGCKQMIKIAQELAAEGRGEAAVIGFDKRLPAVWAAFANAAMAHSLDFGDTHQRSTIHSNSSSFPAALAMAEKMGTVSGKKLLEALVLGSEVAIRIALAADVNTLDHGFYIPTIYSSYGATAAVAKLMGLSAEQIVSAFSFNLCQTTCSSELTNSPKTVLRSVREAFAARNAIVACCMAKENLIGFEAPLEGKLGFYHAFLHGNYTAERALDGLGVHFEAGDLTFKAWPCCFGTHSAITAASIIAKEEGITADDVRHIQVYVGAQNRMLFEPLDERRNPETSIIGKFSIPFTLATMLIRGNVDLTSFSYENLRDEKIRALAAKIDYTYMDEWQRGKETYTRVVMDTTKGTFDRLVKSPFGTPDNPMNEDTFNLKFDACASNAINPKSQEALEALKAAIRSLDSLENISELTELL